MISGSQSIKPFLVLLAVVGTLACGGGTSPDQPADGTKIAITTTSDEARAAYLEGRKLLEDLRFTDAHEYFGQAVAADPDFAMAHLGFANTSSTAREFFAALQRAVTTSAMAGDGERMQIMAFEAGINGEPERQRAQLETLVAAYPEDERAHNALGQLYFANQDYPAAIAEYRRTIEINPDFPPPYNQLGYALRAVGNFDEAERAFQRYIELIPDQPNPYDSYAELQMKLGRYEESIETYERALEVDPNFTASYVGIANNLMFTGRFDDARAVTAKLEAVARTDAERRQACTWSAASFLYEGAYDAALAQIQRRFDIASATADQPSMSGDLNAMGDIMLRMGRFDEAAQKYLESVEMMQGSVATDEIKLQTARNLHYDMARVALWKGDVAAATEQTLAYREAVEEHGILFELRQSRKLDGMVALAEGDSETALTDLTRAGDQDPQTWLLRARAHAAAGDVDAARQACEQVINFNQPVYNLALVRNIAADVMAGL